jgi:hypothetical protein
VSSSSGNTQVRALAVFDDGGGARLHVGGAFTLAGDVVANRIAKWDGASWDALAVRMEGSVESLAVYDDGSGPALHAGGAFLHAGSTEAHRIAKWKGGRWSDLDGGTSADAPSFEPAVHALAVHDDGLGPALYAGGTFTQAGGTAANYVARWDGASWSPLGSGMNGVVNALAVFDDGSGAVLVSGSSGPPHYIARWNGSSWSPMQGGMGGPVLALVAFDDGSGPALYAGGEFSVAGGEVVNQVAKWDGSDWTALAGGMSFQFPYEEAVVHALAVFDDGSGPALYAGGQFDRAGGVSVVGIARWDGSSWSSPGAIGGTVHALAAFDDGTGPALYAGGDFTIAGGLAANRIARWDGSSWSALGSGLSSGSVLALLVFDDGSGPDLYVGGSFGGAFDSGDSYLARWGCRFPVLVPSRARVR